MFTVSVQRAPVEPLEGKEANGIKSIQHREVSPTALKLAPRMEPCPIELYELLQGPSYIPEEDDGGDEEENMCSALAAGRQAAKDNDKEKKEDEADTEEPTVKPAESPTHTSLLEVRRDVVDDDEALDDEDVRQFSGYLEDDENTEEPAAPTEAAVANGPLSVSSPARFKEEPAAPGAEEFENEHLQELQIKTLNTTDQIHGVDPMLAFIAQEMAASALTAGRDAVKPAEETHRRLTTESLSLLEQGDDQVDKFMAVIVSVLFLITLRAVLVVSFNLETASSTDSTTDSP